jgi:catechol 2,3-dioxygenase-like lactoylglutathione lyase family enzyme
MITQIRHTGLVVADLERALKFWCDVLGFRVSKKMEESGSHIDAMFGLKEVKLTTAKLAAPDGHLIELLYFHSHPDQPDWKGTVYSTGFTHIALTVDDLDATCQKLVEAGVTFYAPPQSSPDGYVKVTYGRGPEGVLLELVEMLKK